MSRKKDAFYSITHNRCPRCHEGAFWRSNNPIKNFIRKDKMHAECDCCGLRYEREAGFWYGAMYISYALNVALFILSCATIFLITGSFENPWIYILGSISISFLFSPLNFYLSRLIWINIFTKYDGEHQGCEKEKTLKVSS